MALVEKVSVSLPSYLIKFVEGYKNSHHTSRSQVIVEALQLLQERELEEAYRQANQEIDTDWDVTTADGLFDEAW